MASISVSNMLVQSLKPLSYFISKIWSQEILSISVIIFLWNRSAFSSGILRIALRIERTIRSDQKMLLQQFYLETLFPMSYQIGYKIIILLYLWTFSCNAMCIWQEPTKLQILDIQYIYIYLII